MKKSLLLPLSLGLLLAGCNHATSQKTYTADTSNPANEEKVIRTVSVENNTPPPAPVADAPAVIPPVKVVENPAAAKAEANAIAAIDAPNAPIAPPNPALAQGTIAPSPKAAAEPMSAHSPSNPGIKDAQPSLSNRITEWKLTPADIKDEVQAGRVERSRPHGAGEPTGPMDEAVVKQIDRKLKIDGHTTDLKIQVEANKGTVTLNGSAPSLEIIGKVIALSLDTEGVTEAVSLITLAP